MINSNEIMDTSWLNEYESISNIERNYCREEMSEIDVFFVYSTGSLIEHIINDKIELVDMKIGREQLLQMIQNKKGRDSQGRDSQGRDSQGRDSQGRDSQGRDSQGRDSRKYQLMDILVYNVDLEPENIQKYAKSGSGSFLKVLPIVDEIVLLPSIFIFHSLNAIYFMFKEVEKKPLKPILKIGPSSVTKTKRVRICPSVDNHTRKQRSDEND